MHIHVHIPVLYMYIYIYIYIYMYIYMYMYMCTKYVCVGGMDKNCEWGTQGKKWNHEHDAVETTSDNHCIMGMVKKEDLGASFQNTPK